MATTGPWPSQAPYPKHHFSQMLEETARRLPDKPALIDVDEKPYSYQMVWQAARKTARFLQDEANVAKGETVAVYAPNCPEYAVVLHGALLAGAKVTTLNPLYREREVEHQLDDADAVVVFAAKPLMPTAEEAKDHLPKIRQVYEIEELWQMIAPVPDNPAPVDIDPEADVAVLPYSSGTTGLPKGVMLSHYNLSSNIRQMRATGLVREESVLLAFLPFFHIYGLMVLLNGSLTQGATCLVMPRFDPDQTLYLIEKHKVTDFFVVPPALLALSHHPKLDQHDHSSLRFVLSGAAPLPAEVAELAAQRFGCTMLQGYGMTETSPLTNTSPLDAVKADSVGPPVPDTQEKIVDMSTGEELPVGETGELLIHGPQVMLGYWKSPDATKETIRSDGPAAADRWLRSGDIARMDEDGYLYIVDRAKEMIKYKGYQVAPAELEGVVMEHPAVLDAAVIPKRHFEAGEIPKAFV
ncbi:MAG: AMP-binding protein, partial [Dehalococcoidia bacterium]|nr:AMP-binding protein [Dehalococcoidia bacterium]